MTFGGVTPRPGSARDRAEQIMASRRSLDAKVYDDLLEDIVDELAKANAAGQRAALEEAVDFVHEQGDALIRNGATGSGVVLHDTARTMRVALLAGKSGGQ
jgi:hypothetical protein